MNTPPHEVLSPPQEPKPAVQSVGVLGNTASIVAAITGLIVAKTSLPPEVVSPIVGSLATILVTSGVALFGRIRAKGPIKGIMPSSDTISK